MYVKSCVNVHVNFIIRRHKIASAQSAPTTDNLQTCNIYTYKHSLAGKLDLACAPASCGCVVSSPG